MPRYFFHFASKDEFVPDCDGLALESIEAAHLHARRLIAAVASARLSHWTIEITDDRQYVLLAVLIPDSPSSVASRPFFLARALKRMTGAAPRSEDWEQHHDAHHDNEDGEPVADEKSADQM